MVAFWRKGKLIYGVRVWRNLKTIGVHYIQQSVCICPDTVEFREKLKKLELLIVQNSGEFRGITELFR